MSLSKPPRFSAEELESLNTWTGPKQFGAARSEPVQQQSPVTLTVDQIEAIQKQAYDEAFQQGRQEGFAQGKQEGYEEGRQLGLEQGKQQGYQENLHLLKQQADQLVMLLETFAEPFQKLDEEIEQELVKLVIVIAGQIIRREIKINPGEIVAVVREAVRALPVASQKVTLNLHPDDVQLVRAALDLEETSSPWRIVENPLITRGGCSVETETSYVDATLEKRLAAVTAAVWGGERGEDAAR